MRPKDNPVFPLSPKVEEALGQARLHLGQLSVEQAARGERAIRAQFGRAERDRRGKRSRLGFMAAAVAAAATFALFFALHQRVALAPLSCQVENGTLSHGRILAKDRQAAALRFSDGTEVELGAGTEASLRSVTSQGASIVMSEGRLHASVVHSEKSEWNFYAGPYGVHVTGTSFELLWEPQQDLFDLKLEQGAVTVQAPVSNGPIPVRAGQWLTIRAHSNEVLIRDLTTAQTRAQAIPSSAPPPVGQELAQASTAGAEPTPLPEAASSAPITKRNWAKALALGKLEQIVEEADAQGLEACLATASIGDLSALADAARYTRRSALAKSALLALRRRFVGSMRARDAAFLLGKLAEADHDSKLALTYYDTYLRESPGGRYSSESLGRKLATIRLTEGAPAARPIAELYLTQYPTGAYAKVARAILSEP